MMHFKAPSLLELLVHFNFQREDGLSVKHKLACSQRFHYLEVIVYIVVVARLVKLVVLSKSYHTDLAENETLNREAADQSNLPEGETFTMANFTYANAAVVLRMFEHLQNIVFPGISVSLTTMVYYP